MRAGRRRAQGPASFPPGVPCAAPFSASWIKRLCGFSTPIFWGTGLLGGGARAGTEPAPRPGVQRAAQSCPCCAAAVAAHISRSVTDSPAASAARAGWGMLPLQTPMTVVTGAPLPVDR